MAQNCERLLAVHTSLDSLVAAIESMLAEPIFINNFFYLHRLDLAETGRDDLGFTGIIQVECLSHLVVIPRELFRRQAGAILPLRVEPLRHRNVVVEVSLQTVLAELVPLLPDHVVRAYVSTSLAEVSLRYAGQH